MRPHLGGVLAVTATTGRLFASLCLAKLGRPGCTWADAATLLGLHPGAGIDAVRACTGEIACGPRTLLDRLAGVAAELAQAAVDYRAREAAVRALANQTGWYEAWARRYRPGALASSRRYAITWLWTIHAGSTSRLSPG